jgi:hypothetical protein
MNVVAYVNPAERRGVPFDAYVAVLGPLIRGGVTADRVVIVPADRTEVAIDGLTGSAVAQGLLTAAREITRPDRVAGHFGWPLPAAWRDAYFALNDDPASWAAGRPAP